MIRKNIYKWHRTCSLIIAIPVLLWAVSGFMHPIMTNIRPQITTQGINIAPIDSTKIKMPLKTALQLNNIDSLNTVRFVHIDTNWFYQVKVPLQSDLLYISTSNGSILKNGDSLYAEYLARIFLEGDKNTPSLLAITGNNKNSCCDKGTTCVLNNVKGVPYKDITLVTAFDNVYQSINRLLPVYKVSFDRPDGIRIYVQTTQDRFAFAADNYRAVFSILFSLIHTWKWIDFLGKGRLVVVMFFSGLAFLTTLMGIYIFFSTKSKKVKGNDLVKARRNHRFTSIVISLFTLMFTFSGCYHAFSELTAKKNTDCSITNTFETATVNLDIHQLQSIVKIPITNVGLIKLNGISCWQVYVGSNTSTKEKDLMKDMEATEPQVIYVNTNDYSIIKNGEAKYADYLATQFSKQNEAAIRSTSLITNFNNDYDFSDKLLPVWKVSYATNHNERYYIETATGNLSKHINDKEIYQSYSFAFLHKQEFLEGFGKGVKDFSTMFWAFAQIVMVAIGLTLYFKWRKKKKQL